MQWVKIKVSKKESVVIHDFLIKRFAIKKAPFSGACHIIGSFFTCYMIYLSPILFKKEIIIAGIYIKPVHNIVF
jgi:hypothetical protein